jgi:hypothetical protein
MVVETWFYLVERDLRLGCSLFADMYGLKMTWGN